MGRCWDGEERRGAREAGPCPGGRPACAGGARCSAAFSCLCARSLGNRTPAISVPLAAQRRWGFPFLARLSPPGPGFLVLSRCPCQGRGDASLVSLAGAGRDLLRLVPLSPPAPPSLPCREDHAAVAFAAGMRLPLPRAPWGFPGLHLSCEKPKPTAPNQHNICVLSCIWEQLRRTHRASVSSRSGCAGPCAALGQLEGHGCCPRTGLWFWAQLLQRVCDPGGVLAAGRAEPGPPCPPSHLAVPHGDKNIPPAAAHLAPGRSSGNSSKKLKNKRPKRGRYRTHSRSERAENSGDMIHQSYRS